MSSIKINRQDWLNTSYYRPLANYRRRLQRVRWWARVLLVFGATSFVLGAISALLPVMTPWIRMTAVTLSGVATLTCLGFGMEYHRLAENLQVHMAAFQMTWEPVIAKEAKPTNTSVRRKEPANTP